ncbi:MAG: hypothetical protein K0Q53_2848 [Massilibacillus sp.]|nr:hypothetical protein [Massilibacillus sp.]
MKLGIFSKTFADLDFETAIQKINDYNLNYIQFNFANIGLKSMPEIVTEDEIRNIASITKKYSVKISAISGTFNALEQDKEKLERNLHCFRAIVESARNLNVPIVSISTGSFNQENFWASHPENHTEKAWHYLINSLHSMLKIAEDNHIILAFEPEQANVVSTSKDAVRLIEYFQSKNLRVLFDAANIINVNNADKMLETIYTSVDQLKDYIVLAHCKDILATKEYIKFVPVGQGNLPLKKYIDYLTKSYDGPIIMHGLEKKDIPHALKYLNI